MKIYRFEQSVLTPSFTDDETYSIIPPGNQAVDVPDNLWAQYEMKIVELQQIKNAINEYFGQPVAVEPKDNEPDSDELKDEWK